MNEQTLNKPLSGTEIIDIVCHQIKTAMQRDCFLAGHLAYPSFSYGIDIKIKFQNTNTKTEGTSAYVAGSIGEEEAGVEVKEQEVALEGGYDAPNQARIENDIPVPVITRTPQGGIEEKRIKYSDPKFAERARKGK